MTTPALIDRLRRIAPRIPEEDCRGDYSPARDQLEALILELEIEERRRAEAIREK